MRNTGKFLRTVLLLILTVAVIFIGVAIVRSIRDNLTPGGVGDNSGDGSGGGSGQNPGGSTGEDPSGLPKAGQFQFLGVNLFWSDQTFENLYSGLGCTLDENSYLMYSGKYIQIGGQKVKVTDKVVERGVYVVSEACAIHDFVLTYVSGDDLLHNIKAVCRACGATESRGEGSHTWEDGTCTLCHWTCMLITEFDSYVSITAASHTSKYVCSNCGKVEIKTANHTWDNGTCKICKYACSHVWGEEMCTRCGLTHPHDYNYSYSDKTSTTHKAIGVCKVCGYEFTSVDTHSWDNGTCTICGYVCIHDESLTYTSGEDQSHTVKYACKICGSTGTRYEAHVWHDGTCTLCHWTCSETPVFDRYGQLTATQHTRIYVCSNCGKEESETKDHTWKFGYCSVCGYTCNHVWDGSLCTKCGWNHVHDYDYTYSDITSTTHKASGTCKICQFVFVSTDNHTWQDGKCTECSYSCAHDGCSYTYSNSNESQHTVSFTCPTCSLSSSNAVFHSWDGGTCTDCGYTCAHTSWTECVSWLLSSRRWCTECQDFVTFSSTFTGCGHDFGLTVSCADMGYTKLLECTHCGKLKGES